MRSHSKQQRSTSSAGRGGKRVARFIRDENGATAIEFAFIALPFFGLIFAIVQVSLFLFISSALQTALLDAARPLWTRQSAQIFPPYTNFKQSICSRMPMFDCSKIRLQMQAYTDIAAVDPEAFNSRCFKEDNPPADICFKPGGARDLVVLRVAYAWPFGLGLADFNGTSMLINTVVFRNESF